MRVSKKFALFTTIAMLLLSMPSASADSASLGPVGVGYGAGGSGASAGYASCALLSTACAGAVVAIAQNICAEASGTIDIFGSQDASFKLCASVAGAAGGGLAAAIIEGQVRGEATVVATVEDGSGSDCAWYNIFCDDDAALSSTNTLARAEAPQKTETRSNDCADSRSRINQIGDKFSCVAGVLYTNSAICLTAEANGFGRSTAEDQAAASKLSSCDTGPSSDAVSAPTEVPGRKAYRDVPVEDLPAEAVALLQDQIVSELLSTMLGEVDHLESTQPEGDALYASLRDTINDLPSSLTGTVTVYVNDA